MKNVQLNTDLIATKRKIRADKIVSLVKNKGKTYLEASIFLDTHGKQTTNRKMLQEVGFTFEKVTTENADDIVEALAAINVTVIVGTATREEVVKTLNIVVDESITECWGGDDMREFVEVISANSPPNTDGVAYDIDF